MPRACSRTGSPARSSQAARAAGARSSSIPRATITASIAAPSVIKPNRRELAAAAAVGRSTTRRRARRRRARANGANTTSAAMLVTCGKDGMLLIESERPTPPPAGLVRARGLRRVRRGRHGGGRAGRGACRRREPRSSAARTRQRGGGHRRRQGRHRDRAGERAGAGLDRPRRARASQGAAAVARARPCRALAPERAGDRLHQRLLRSAASRARRRC